MKIKFLLYLLFVKSIAFSQVVTDNITFDNTSDFTNFFTNYSSTGLTQNSGNGVANSGSLTTPNTISNNAVFCSKYKNSPSAVTKTSICFKYNSTLVNPNSFNSAAGIYLHPSADWNHYIMTYIRQNKQLEIYSYSWASANDNTIILNLLDNHWYKLQLTTTVIGGNFGDQIEILSEVFELGLNGTSTPVLMNSILKTNYYDITFAQDLAVEASFGGSKWGGSNYLDNFKFEGVKSLNSCNTLSTTNFSENNITNFSAFPNPTNSVINIKTKLNIIDDFSINVINNLGQIILTQKISTTDFQLDLRNLKATGIYLLTITDKQDRILETKKIIIN